MIYLIHGSNVVLSRKRLVQLKAAYPSHAVQEFVSKDVDYPDLTILFSTVSMFDEKKLVVVEGKVDHNLLDLNVLSRSESADLVVWIDSTLRSNDGLLSALKGVNATVELFEEKDDTSIFPFLDALVQRKRLASIDQYHALLKADQDPIYILTMIVWQFRMVLVPELAKGIGQKKALQLREQYSFEELRWIYYQLLLLDVAFKSGETMPEVALEQFIFKITK